MGTQISPEKEVHFIRLRYAIILETVIDDASANGSKTIAHGGSGILIKFGICVPQDGLTYQDIKQAALLGEEFGFNSVWLFDHLHSFPRPDREPFLECWTTLSALAEATKRVRLGSLVLNVHYRNPALIAKMAATLDNITNGRLELGIGAGGTTRAHWLDKLGYTMEYRAYGMNFPEKATTRMRILEEAVQIIKRLWSDAKSSFAGEYYRIDSAFCYPKPIQQPHPPIWIGGMGEKLLLKIVAKFADGCNFAWNLSPEEYKEKLKTLDRYCRIAGRSTSNIRRSLLTACVPGNTSDEVRKALQIISKAYGNIEGYIPYAQAKGAFVGTTEDCIGQIDKFIDAGADQFMLVFPQDRFEYSLKLFAKNIMPSF